MARKKRETDESGDQVKDQPERDIFDEDEEDTTGPPVLPEGHPDAAVASQDAAGDVPTQQKDQSTQADPERVPGDGEKAANEAVLNTKGDLQPVVDQRNVDPMVSQGVQVQAGQDVDTNSPEFRDAVRRFLLAEMQKEDAQFSAKPQVGKEASPSGEAPEAPNGYKVMRGMVGSFPEGTVIPGSSFLGTKVTPSDLKRLVDAGVIQPYEPEKS